MKWDALRDIDECEQLNEEIEGQRKNFALIMNTKEKLI